MRVFVVALMVGLISGCSSAETSSPPLVSTPTVAPSSSPTVASKSAAKSDACDLLTTAEIAKLIKNAADAKPGLTGGVPNCQWASPDGPYVQVIGVEASEWARSLPEIVRALEASGQFSDAANLRKLRAAAKLVEGGTDLDSKQACALFSQMVELQGQPPKTTYVVTVIPTRADPKAVSGQMCSIGTFTSVMVADPAGLDAPLPIEEVGKAARAAHRRAIG